MSVCCGVRVRVRVRQAREAEGAGGGGARFLFVGEWRLKYTVLWKALLSEKDRWRRITECRGRFTMVGRISRAWCHLCTGDLCHRPCLIGQPRELLSPDTLPGTPGAIAASDNRCDVRVPRMHSVIQYMGRCGTLMRVTLAWPRDDSHMGPAVLILAAVGRADQMMGIEQRHVEWDITCPDIAASFGTRRSAVSTLDALHLPDRA